MGSGGDAVGGLSVVRGKDAIGGGGVLAYFGVGFCWIGGGMVGVMVGNG